MDFDRARLPAGGNARHPAGHLVPSTVGWTVAGMALCATAVLSSAILPAPLVLLATGSMLALAGFGVAATLLVAGRRMGRDGTVGWDTAAALVFLGFAAALLADTGEALTALADLRHTLTHGDHRRGKPRFLISSPLTISRQGVRPAGSDPLSSCELFAVASCERFRVW